MAGIFFTRTFASPLVAGATGMQTSNSAEAGSNSLGGLRKTVKPGPASLTLFRAAHSSSA